MKINTNLSSLIVQSGLKASTNGLNTAIERMTTGFKINHAKDNAANYAINTKLSSKLSSYYAAQDNASMGLDMMTSAMENLDLISSHLSRIRNLAEQAANGTYSGESLRAIQSEVDGRLAEGQRIIQNSNYNGIQLFQTPEKESESKFIKEVVRLSEEEALAQGYTLIKTADELQAMQDNLSGKYILMNDIDLAGYDWTAVGTYDNRFAGEFNGNGYVISNLTINEPTKQYQGLFGWGDGRTSYSNVGLENVNVKGYNYTGGLIGGGAVYIDNCYVTGAVSGDYYVGGIIGDHCSYMYDSFSTGFVTGNNYVGGLIGDTYGDVKNCYSLSKVQGIKYAGSLIGCYRSSADGTITDCGYDASINPGLPAIGLNKAGFDESTLISDYKIARPVLPNIITFQIGIASGDSSQMSFDLEFTLDLSIEISDSESARKALNQIDELMAKINQRQTEFGSAYNRLESALETIGVHIDNLTSTQSTIRDADIAEESSAYIRNQILQQASATLLATANQTPAIAMQLL